MLTRDHKTAARNIPWESAAFGPGTKSPINFRGVDVNRSSPTATRRPSDGKRTG